MGKKAPNQPTLALCEKDTHTTTTKLKKVKLKVDEALSILLNPSYF